MADATRRWRLTRAGAVVSAVAIASLLLKLHRLGHLALHGLDESFHAVVARNLIARPLVPILYARHYLPVDSHDWQHAHIWLHKGIVPLWQMAVSMALLGQSTFAMRLPSAILGTVSVLLTYAIGVRLAGRWAAAAAATLQAFNPVLVYVTQGLVFSDHVDIALLFWTELSIWLMLMAAQQKRGLSPLWALAAGAAQGFAFCSKSYPALIATGVAIVAVMLPWIAAEDENCPRLRGRDLFWMIVGTVVTAGPWLIYCRVRFAGEFAFEQVHVLRHLTEDIEGWAGPWDRVAFDYLLEAFHRLYPMLLAAVVVMIVRFRRDGRVLLLAAWLIGTIAPHLLATSKTPTATMVGWPAGWLILGVLFERAVRGDLAMALVWITTAALALLAARKLPTGDRGFVEGGGAAAVMLQNIWVLWHAAAGIAAGMIGAVIQRQWRARPQDSSKLGTTDRVAGVRGVAVVAGAITAALLAFQVRICWLITRTGPDAPAFVETGQYVRDHLPVNAVLLVEEEQKLTHMTAMFYCDRCCYATDSKQLDWMTREVIAEGGLPVLLTRSRMDLPLLLSSERDGWMLYSCPADVRKNSQL